MTRFASNRGNGTSVAQPKALSVLEGKGADAGKIQVESDILAAAGAPSDDSVPATLAHIPGTRPDHVPGLPPIIDTETTASLAGTTSHESSTQTTMAPAPLAANTITGTMDDDVLGDLSATTAVTISGGDGNDTLYGSSAADLLKGDADYDYFVGGAGNDTMDGGDGDYDLVSYAEETGGGGIVVNLSDAAWTFGTATYQSRTGTDTWGSLDTYLNIEAVTGSAQGDVIYAGNSATGWIIDGGAGNDTLTGGGNDDMLIGGAGNDTLINGQVVYLGTQAINANLITNHVSGQGEDTLSNVTYLVGSEGNDTIYGGNVLSTIDGSLGNDVLYAGKGTTIFANEGKDTVHGGMGPSGNFAQPSGNSITGNFTTVLTYEDLSPSKGAVNANIDQGWVDEYFNGTRVAVDRIYKINVLIGSGGNDTITGSANNNTLVGGDGNDQISGFGGSDSLDGGNGNDTLAGSDGYVDTLVGGLGDDYYITGDINDVLIDVGGIDTIQTYLSSYTLKADFENLVSTAYNGTLIGNSSDNKLTSTSYGNDTLDGGAGNDTMIGGDGDDVYYIRDLGDVVIELNGQYSGNDTVIISVKNYDGTKLANIEHIQFVGEGSILGSNSAPVIGGLGSPVTLNVDDNQVINPFSSITVTDTDSATVTAVVTMNHNDGVLTNTGGIGSYDPQTLRYTVTGTAAQVQDALRNLVFDPTDRPNGAVGSTQTTGFTVTVTDVEGAGATPNSNVSVTSTTVNRAPWISYAPHFFTIYDTENANLVQPFGYVAMNELNANDVVTVKIMLDVAGKGALVPVQGGTYDAATGIFTFVGILQDARAAVASLLFNPTDRPNAAAGTVEATSFSITITDSSGATASVTDFATVNSVAVGHVNQAPNAPIFVGGNTTDRASAGQLVGTLSASDPDGDPLTLTFDWAQTNSNGLISADGRFKIVNGTVVVNNPQWLQVDKNETFTYAVTASDGHGGSASSTIAINVADANHVPTAPVLQGNGKVSESAAAHTVVGTLSATDADNDPLNYTFVNALGGTNGQVSGDGRFEIVNGTIQVRDPSLIQVNADTTFNYGVYVTDGYSTKVMGAVAITVTNVNQAPVDLKLSNTVVQEHTAIGQTIAIVNANDPDQNGLTYTLLDDGGGRVELVNNELRVKNNTKIDYEQATSFQVKLAASDGTTSISKTFTLTVSDVSPENVTGTAAADLIRGGSGHDTLSGGAGNDTLAGGAGDDRLTGGLGSDVFLFDTDPTKAGADTILDFNTKDNDHIYLARSVFKGFGAFDIGALQAKAFVLGTAAMDADDRIMYDQATGKVFYDADGNGAGSAVLVATLTTKPVLTASAFFVI
ncbi:beta strand repeat-containing protein [Microvirga puerhi]|uniref:Cadherin domain-containing protein n=1 Tax=Microvirga puerhi TaxID=2876078 RepID=A0ABS7VQ55_9HYPH|nr:calcium-binding protein [Microvirga puerhi]MBZ6077152.1 hypothetical protein [Microvirga puerhi]